MTTVAKQGLDGSRSRFSCRLITAADGEYDQARSVWNGAIDATSRTTSSWPDTQAAQHRKVTQMTTPVTGQPRHPLIRWATAPFRAFRYLNQELLGAGEAIARSNRFGQSGPQAGPVEATHAQPAPVSKVLTRA